MANSSLKEGCLAHHLTELKQFGEVDDRTVKQISGGSTVYYVQEQTMSQAQRFVAEILRVSNLRSIQYFTENQVLQSFLRASF